MKKNILILLYLCTIPTLTGCWDRVEIQDIAIITAAAIDRLEDGKTRVSVQIFIPRAITTGQTGEDLSQGSTFVREGTGDNLANAISMLQVNVPRRLFWGQCKIYIFGEKLAKNGIQKEIDYLARSSGPRGNSFIYVSESEGKKILTLVPPLERYSGEALRKLTEDEHGTKTTLMDVGKGLMGESESISMPHIKKLKPNEKSRKTNDTIPVIDGTAIFKQDKMVGTLNVAESRGLLWLKDKVKRSTLSITLNGEKGEITMTPTRGRTKFSTKIKGNRWIMNLKINMEGELVQNETNLDLTNDEVMKEVEKEYELVLQKKIGRTVEKLQQEINVDVIDFGRRFHQKYPREWMKVNEKWDKKFSEVEVKINVNAVVRKPGNIGPPAALPRDKVKE